MREVDSPDDILRFGDADWECLIYGCGPESEPSVFRKVPGRMHSERPHNFAI